MPENTTPPFFSAPPCNCPSCSQEFICLGSDQRYKLCPLGIKEAKECISMCLDAINEDRQFLSQQLASREKAISELWMDDANRQRYLNAVKLDIHAEESSRSNPELMDHVDEIDQSCWLFPDLNVQELRSDPKVFLSLLSNRVLYHPAEFAVQDSRALSFAWDNKLLDLSYSETCMCIRKDSYGKIQSWDKKLVHRGDYIGFPRAHLTLRAQKHLHIVLRSIVQQIVKEIPPGTSKSSETWSLQSQDLRPKSYSSFLGDHFYQPSSQPFRFSFDYLESIVNSQYEASELRVKLLQTDPKHLKDMIKAMPDDYEDSENFWHVLTDLLIEAIHILMWSGIKDLFKDLRRLPHTRRQDYTVEGRDLSTQEYRFLAQLELVIITYMPYFGTNTKVAFYRHPGFSRLYKQAEEGEMILKEDYEDEPLHVLLSRILEWEPIPDGLDFEDSLSPDYDTLQRKLANHLSEHPNEMARLDDSLIWKLKSHKAMYSLRESLSLCRPRFRPCDIATDRDKFPTDPYDPLLPPLNAEKMFDVSLPLPSPSELPNQHILDLKAFHELKWTEDVLDANYPLLETALDDFWSGVRTPLAKSLLAIGLDKGIVKDLVAKLFSVTSQKGYVSISKAAASKKAKRDKKNRKKEESKGRKDAEEESENASQKDEAPQEGDEEDPEPGTTPESDSTLLSPPNDLPLSDSTASSPELDSSSPLPSFANLELNSQSKEDYFSGAPGSEAASAALDTTTENVSGSYLESEDHSGERPGRIQSADGQAASEVPHLTRKKKKAEKKANRAIRQLTQPPALDESAPSFQEAENSTPKIEDFQIEVPKRAFEMFQKLLAIPQKEKVELSKDEFKSHMEHAGCMVVEAQGCRVKYQCNKTKGNFSDSATLHMPHKEIIEWRQTSNLGKSLRNALGWDETTFVLLDKQKNPD